MFHLGKILKKIKEIEKGEINNIISILFFSDKSGSIHSDEYIF